jgi:hypothetical protein
MMMPILRVFIGIAGLVGGGEDRGLGIRGMASGGQLSGRHLGLREVRFDLASCKSYMIYDKNFLPMALPRSGGAPS